jgi:hypothetical protein
MEFQKNCTALSLSPAVAQAFTHIIIMTYIELIGLLKLPLWTRRQPIGLEHLNKHVDDWVLGIVELSIHGRRRLCNLKYIRGIQSTKENTTCKIADAQR